MSKVNLRQVYLWVLFFSISVTPGINFLHTDEYYQGNFIQRQFGSAITINAFTLLLLIGILYLLKKGRWKVKGDYLTILLIYSCLSVIFPNGQNRRLTIIGIYALIKYVLFLRILTTLYKPEEYKKYMDQAFKGLLWFETFCGVTYVFAGIKIPYVTTWSMDSMRNGFLRMAGTFASGPEFALVIAVLLVYFLVEYLLGHRRSVLKYIFMATFDLWFAGSRTLILVSMLVFSFVLWQKYKKKRIQIYLLIFGLLIVAIIPYTSIFRKLVIENSIVDMLKTRLIHWILAFLIMKDHLCFGVGLNNSVSYIINNPELVSKVYTISLESIGFYYLNPIHNSILILFVELGILGGVIYLGFYVNLIWKSLKKVLRKNIDRNYRKEGIFILCEMMVLFSYALQGWGTLKEFGWILMVIIYSYYFFWSETKKYT